MNARPAKWAALTLLALLGGCDGPSEKETALLQQLEAEAQTRNAAVRVPFDPERHVLVAHHTADQKLHEHLSPVYIRDVHSGVTRAQRVVPSTFCSQPTDPALPSGALQLVLEANSGEPSCLYEAAEAPPVGARVVTLDRTAVDVPATKRLQKVVHRVRMPDGAVYELESYEGVHVSPAGLAGSRESSRIWAAVGRSLGLPPGGPASRPVPEADARALIEQGRTTRLDEEAGRLEALLIAPGVSSPLPDPQLLAARPELLRRNARRIVDAWAAEHAAPRADGAGLKAKGELVAMLDDRDFEPHAARISHVLATGSTSLLDYPAEPLLERIGALGPSALPVMKRRVQDTEAAGRRAARADAVLACRVGPAATAVASALLLRSWEAVNEPRVQHGYPRCRRNDVSQRLCRRAADLGEAEELLYVSLLRLGLRSEAEAGARHGRVSEWRAKHAAVGPRTPIEVCG